MAFSKRDPIAWRLPAGSVVTIDHFKDDNGFLVASFEYITKTDWVFDRRKHGRETTRFEREHCTITCNTKDVKNVYK